jgi:hypothetical protein
MSTKFWKKPENHGAISGEQAKRWDVLNRFIFILEGKSKTIHARDWSKHFRETWAQLEAIYRSKIQKRYISEGCRGTKNIHNAIEMRNYETLARASQTHLSAQSIQINLGRFKDCLWLTWPEITDMIYSTSFVICISRWNMASSVNSKLY